MARKTSIDAYNKIKANGLLKGLQWKVYDFATLHGPISERKAWLGISPNSNSGTITARFAELKNKGVLEEVGRWACQDTGNVVLHWDVTADLPRKINKKEKPPTREELITALALQAEEICDHLESKENTPEKWKTWSLKSRNIIKQASKYIKRKKHVIQ